MTYAYTRHLGPIPKARIVGPYSKWPRKQGRKTRRLTKVSVVVAVAGIGAFAHCAPSYLV